LRDWNDEESWQDFFDTYWKLIFGFARKNGLSEAESEDVLQETMVVVAKQMPGFKYDPAIGSFKGWLLHTTQWKIRDQLRRRQKQAEVTRKLSEDAEAISQGEDQLSQWAAEWDQHWEEHLLEAVLERVKSKVSPRQYQIFQCYVLKRWPVEKVTRLLGVSRPQVYLAKHRVQKLVKQEARHLESRML
jgi:RNA polymerase sigma-70 factor (ECF subfamily)